MPNASRMLSVCVCNTQQIFELLVSALLKKVDHTELTSILVCNTDLLDSMIHCYGSCPGRDKLVEFWTNFF